MTNKIYIDLVEYLNTKIQEDEELKEYKLKSDPNGQYKLKSISIRLITNYDSNLFLNKNKMSEIRIGFYIKDDNQRNIYNVSEKIYNWLCDKRYMDEEEYTIYRFTESDLNISALEDEIYIANMVVSFSYYDKSTR